MSQTIIGQWGSEITIYDDGTIAISHSRPISDAVVTDAPRDINDRWPGTPKNIDPITGRERASCVAPYYPTLLLEPPTKGLRPIRCAGCGKLVDHIHSDCQFHLYPTVCEKCMGES